MSNVTLIVPPSLRRFVDGNSKINIAASTLQEAISIFTEKSPNLRGHLFDEKNNLRRFVRVFLNGRPVTVNPSEVNDVGDGSEITILLALAGG